MSENNGEYVPEGLNVVDNAKYTFSYAGGIWKQDGRVSKFYCFALIPKDETKQYEELIFFEAIKKGFMSRILGGDTEAQDAEYSSVYPIFKIFTLTEGFGYQKQFYSFYFKLDARGLITTIRPLPLKEGDESEARKFIGRGIFLTQEELKKILGEETPSYRFFSKQAPLSKSLYHQIISVDMETMVPTSKVVRKIRI